MTTYVPRGGLALLGLLWACASSPPPVPTPAVDPGPLRLPSEMPFNFQWNQHVTAIWPDGKRSFDAVLQKRDGELILIGLSPAGLPGFIFRLRPDGTLRVENRTGRELPFAPEYILADVQRVYFPWLPAERSGDARSGQVGPLRVVERYAGGSLVARSFSRNDGAVEGTVRIDYAPLREGEDVSRRVVVDNDWFDYRLIIETRQQARLPP